MILILLLVEAAHATCMVLPEPLCVTTLCGPAPWATDEAPAFVTSCQTAQCWAGPPMDEESAELPRPVAIAPEELNALLRIEEDRRIRVPGTFDPPLPGTDGRSGVDPGVCRTFTSPVLPGSYTFNGLAFEVVGEVGDDRRLPWPPGVPFPEDGLHVPEVAPSGEVRLDVVAVADLPRPEGFEVVWASPRTVELRRDDLHVRVSIEGHGWLDQGWAVEWRTGPAGARGEGTAAWTEGALRSEGTWRSGRPDGRFRSWDTNGRLVAEARFVAGDLASWRAWSGVDLVEAGELASGRPEGTWAVRPRAQAPRPPWVDERMLPTLEPRVDRSFRIEATFREGVLDGPWVERAGPAPDAQEVLAVAFCDGAPCGREVQRAREGEIVLRGRWGARGKTGRWKEYAWGRHSKVEHYTGDELDGRYVRWGSGAWGRWIVEERGWYRDGQKHGPWKRYDAYGGVAEVEVWRRGALVRRR